MRPLNSNPGDGSCGCTAGGPDGELLRRSGSRQQAQRSIPPRSGGHLGAEYKEVRPHVPDERAIADHDRDLFLAVVIQLAVIRHDHSDNELSGAHVAHEELQTDESDAAVAIFVAAGECRWSF